MRYDYYRIDVPEDCADTRGEREDIAIIEARERTRSYCIPCDWTVIRWEGDIAIVRRRRN